MKIAESSPNRENTVRKEEIVCYEQFLLLPQCFQKTCTTYTYKPGLVWERVKKKRKENVRRKQKHAKAAIDRVFYAAVNIMPAISLRQFNHPRIS